MMQQELDRILDRLPLMVQEVVQHQEGDEEIEEPRLMQELLVVALLHQLVELVLDKLLFQ